ncbi:DUF2156 domain-containing protein, partial [bacterium]|nr:DUF2156 domain-containing protein [bacterium]
PSASLSELERRALRKVELISTLEDLPPGANGVLHPLMSPLFSPSGGPALRGLFLRAAKRETLSSFALCQGRLCARLLVSRRGAAHYHVELFRRTPTAPLGTIEALLLNVITVLARREALTLSLGEVPFAPEGVTFGVPGNARSSAMRAFERSFSSGGRALLECGYSVQGLYEFKNKFSPHWEPTFWCFPSSSSLPTWWAILRATRIEALLRYGLRRRLKKLS